MPLDGLISFYSWHFALRAESVLTRQGYRVELIPGPRELSPNCGTALRFDLSLSEPVLKSLQAAKVQIETTHKYRPELEKSREASPPVEVSERGRPGRIRGWIGQLFGA